MRQYKDIDNNSEIEGYEYDNHRITLRFKGGDEKDYSDTATGTTISFFDLDSLKARADEGRGLDEYIKVIEERACLT